MRSRQPSIAVVGTGPVGCALAAAYVAGGGEVACVVSRSRERADDVARGAGAALGSDDPAAALRADVVLVAVADPAIGEVGARFAALPAAAGRLLLHTSGALPGAALGGPPLRAGSLHPLQTFTAAAGPPELRGTHWFHEGEGAAEAEAMVGVWRGVFHRLAPRGKALYHAGAAVLSNHTVALFDAALRLFEAAGVPRAEAHSPLAELLAGTERNLRAVGVPQALTGPVARGDADTVKRHLDALAAAAPELVESYAALARRAVVVALAKGTLTPEAAAAIERSLASSRPRGTG